MVKRCVLFLLLIGIPCHAAPTKKEVAYYSALPVMFALGALMTWFFLKKSSSAKGRPSSNSPRYGSLWADPQASHQDSYGRERGICMDCQGVRTSITLSCGCESCRSCLRFTLNACLEMADLKALKCKNCQKPWVDNDLPKIATEEQYDILQNIYLG